ncbi:MAG TPA: aminotransferase class III-fold pyridoxal phosphate-dependent enzyme [Thermoanaerobaculaceae bacterium]|nr:aminotransferase class III-fold pyridoxal phosphate-dependent enzyme [Thermoanaerobaculaceae bacterium]
MTDYTALQKRVLVDTYVNRGLTIVRGEGAFVFDVEGRRYLDLTSAYGTAVLGYGHPALTRAVSRQLETLHVLHCSFASDVRVDASRALLARVGPPLKRVFWSNSGAEAVEAALKLAALATGRHRIVACVGAFHGKTLGALSLTHDPRYRAGFEPLLWDVVHVPFGDADALGAAADGAGAVFVEPIQGESGVRPAPPGFLRAAREICDGSGALLVLDEVQTGVGRTGRFLACHGEGVAPDVVCLGKGLAGGVPAGATLVTEAVASRAHRGAHSTTFGGNPLAAAGVMAVLEVLTDEFLEAVAAGGERFMGRLRDVGEPRVVEVRGRGLMVAVEVAGDRDRVLRDLQAEGVLALSAGPSAVRFLPPYVTPEPELARAAEVLAAALRRV